MNLSFKGFIYALYVDEQFIDYFDSTESATAFAGKHYGQLKYFVKPVAYFTYNEEKK